jgi:hypothetical protein
MPPAGLFASGPLRDIPASGAQNNIAAVLRFIQSQGVALGSKGDIATYGVGEFTHEPYQLPDIAFIPRREYRAPVSFACPIDGVCHGFALRCHEGLADPTIRGGGMALDKAEAFQLRNLPANGRVIATNPVSEIDDADGASPSDDNERRKQRTIERYAGFPNHHLITLGSIDNADDFDQCLVQRPDLFTYMCIPHSFSRRHIDSPIMCILHVWRI